MPCIVAATPAPGGVPAPVPQMSLHEDASSLDVTAMLVAWSGGDRDAPESLMNAVYSELHRQASRAMNREPDHATLQATALVHEAYLRLVDQRRVTWRNRSHFFGIAAQLMRRILVDHARGRLADKRGGDQTPVTLTDSGANAVSGADSPIDVMALHDALNRLALLDPDQARIVELRYFGGLTIEETAEAIGIGPTTVKAEWAIARAWLRRELGES
ncbi:MAG: sigma-70 family RNA polymerase sigma factor [Gemmatimonas sp.]